MKKIDLSGQWRVWLESAAVSCGKGASEQEACEASVGEKDGQPDCRGKGSPKFTDTVIQLPGCTAEIGLGDPIGPDTKWIGSEFGKEFSRDDLYEPYRRAENYKYPYWLQPETRFMGKAFYERDVELPGESSDAGSARPLFYKLFLERCHWKSRVWLDGELLGDCDNLCLPHVYVFKAVPGRHKLRICIDNSLIHDVGPNAHSMSDHTQGNWNGIIGRMEIVPISPVEIEKVVIYPDIVRKSFVVKTELINRSERTETVCVSTEASFSEGKKGENELKFLPLLEDKGKPGEQKPVSGAEKSVTVSVPPFKAISVYREIKPVLPGVEVEADVSVDADPRVSAIGGSDSGNAVGCVLPAGASSLPEDTLLWDEFQPSLIKVDVSLEKCSEDGKKLEKLDEKSVRSGLRELSTEGHKLLINGRPLFLRGTLDCCVFPKTGYPPCTAEEWRRIYGVIKACGLNHIRFHSWCPPEVAFDLADEEGIYLQVECPLWKNQGSPFDGDPAFNSWLFAESERIVDEYGNHPSFILFNSGNEPDGSYHDILGLWTEFWKKKDGRRLYNASSCWPVNPENQFEVNSDPRLQQWGAEMSSEINSLPPETSSDFSDIFGKFQKPAIVHEMGQWCVFPDFKEMALYTGYLKPRNYEVFKDILERRGLLPLADKFLEVSGKHQLLCYKEEVEKNLRTGLSSGFQLLGLNDFPGQGTALVGVLNAFWKEKGYCSKEDFHAFCGSSVLLCLMEKRVFTEDEKAVFHIKLYRYEKSGKARAGAGEPQSAEQESLTAKWYVSPIAAGPVPHRGDIPAAVLTGEFSFSAGSCGVYDAGQVSVPLNKLCLPCGYTFTAELVEDSRNVSGAPDSNGLSGAPDSAAASNGSAAPSSAATSNGAAAPSSAKCRNSWNFWLYPKTVDLDSAGLYVSDRPDEKLFETLENGGSALLLLPSERVETDVKTGFSSVFWNTAWTEGQGPHTLGVLCRNSHPIFKAFPTENWADWQWWYLMHDASSMVLDQLPESLEPLVQPVDTWFRSHKLGMLFECRVGKGRLVVTSSPLSPEMVASACAGVDPVRRQYLHSILEYMKSADFKPAQTLTKKDIDLLCRK